MRGTSGEGQASFFSQLLKGYIEETSVSVAGFVRLPNANTYYINNLANAESSVLGGQGGESSSVNPTPDLSLVQQNSVMSTGISKEFAEKTGKRSQTLEYTVQPGDAITFIASDYGVSVNSILWANNIKNADSIKVGQVLRIPPVTGVIYTVKRGDTIESISRRYQAELDKVLEFNDLDANSPIQIGMELMIPDGKMQATQTAAYSAQPAARFSYLPNLVGYYILPTTGYSWGIAHGRNGNDIANVQGTPIYAAAEGNVVTATSTGWNGGYGKYIKIVHPNGTETLYAHLSKVNVTVGQTVTQGQIIGLMGTTGRSTGSHLHFEVHGAKNPYFVK